MKKDKKKLSEYDRFMALSDEQKDAEVAIFDEEDLSPGRPISMAERRKFKAWQKRAVGRPRIGEGFRRWNISLEKSIARDADAYARKHGKTRSGLVVEAIKSFIRQDHGAGPAGRDP